MWLALLGSSFIAVPAFAQEMRTLVRPRADQVLTPVLREELVAHDTARAWVYFTDKAVLTSASLDRALDAARTAQTPRARERRRLRGSPLGVRDLLRPTTRGR